MSESKQKLIAENERVLTEDGTHIATVWEEIPDESRLPGESWIGMRIRTGPMRDVMSREAVSRARQFAAAPELVEALRIAEKKLVELEGQVGGGDDEIYVEGAILTIRAALAKAGA